MIKITFLEDFRKFKQDEVLIFECDKTLLVGNNGTGKSTLLQIIYQSLPHDEYENFYVGDRHEYEDVRLNNKKYKVEHDYDYVFIFDPILDDPNKNIHAMDRHPVLSTKTLFAGNRGSTGEFALFKYREYTDLIVDRCNGIDTVFNENTEPLKGKKLLLIDEPENGLSLKNQYRVAKSILAVCRDGGLDTICTTHSIPFIERPEYSLYDIESKTIVKSDEYLNSLKG